MTLLTHARAHSRTLDASQPDIALVGEETYAVLSATETLGFVYRAGNIYVALSGPDLGRGYEVGQSLSWDEAVAIVQRSHHSASHL